MVSCIVDSSFWEQAFRNQKQLASFHLLSTSKRVTNPERDRPRATQITLVHDAVLNYEWEMGRSSSWRKGEKVDIEASDRSAGPVLSGLQIFKEARNVCGFFFFF